MRSIRSSNLNDLSYNKQIGADRAQRDKNKFVWRIEIEE